ncbi:hypothetical protein [Falsiroseomonas tokyonensis]|uniref:Uncharacterized protein n=1 Tax=Falsiroseomonas tokyonensis TaxID=430521 RepID=A0ABV7BVC1_9PROT|nr:hypothetical protein [Falsiroseomonas tokyonensis]MBU8538577.1 hypothetical protein [Falsiroseomonas tokyonensis]
MDDPPAPASRKTEAQLAREARLAAALRENLRRRKAQARARAEPPEIAPPSAAPPATEPPAED